MVSYAVESLDLEFVFKVETLHPALDKPPSAKVWQVSITLIGRGEATRRNVQKPGHDEGGWCTQVRWHLHKRKAHVVISDLKISMAAQWSSTSTQRTFVVLLKSMISPNGDRVSSPSLPSWFQ